MVTLCATWRLAEDAAGKSRRKFECRGLSYRIPLALRLTSPKRLSASGGNSGYFYRHMISQVAPRVVLFDIGVLLPVRNDSLNSARFFRPAVCRSLKVYSSQQDLTFPRNVLLVPRNESFSVWGLLLSPHWEFRRREFHMSLTSHHLPDVIHHKGSGRGPRAEGTFAPPHTP